MKKPTWRHRLTKRLEPILREADPRANISSYHDMPYAIFRYSPEDEFALREELSLMKTRLEQTGKRVTVISLAQALSEALKRAGLVINRIETAEKMTGLDKMSDTLLEVLSVRQPLDQLVAEQIPQDADPCSIWPSLKLPWNKKANSKRLNTNTLKCLGRIGMPTKTSLPFPWVRPVPSCMPYIQNAMLLRILGFRPCRTGPTLTLDAWQNAVKN